jgi:hypothetical protein
MEMMKGGIPLDQPKYFASSFPHSILPPKYINRKTDRNKTHRHTKEMKDI